MSAYDVTIWMKLYVGDFLRETALLTTQQIGAYILLNLYYWSTGGKALPDDDEQLARIAKLSIDDFIRIRNAILVPFFTLRKDGWKNLKLDKEIAAARALRAKYSQRGRIGAHALHAKIRASKNDIPI